MRLLGFLALPLTLSCMNAGAALAPLTVSGNQVLIGGQQGSLAGIGLFWSNSGWGGEKYYTPQTLAWLKTDWKASVVRIPMGVDEPNGYLGNASTPADPTNKDRVFAAIDAAIANDLYVIVDWHTHHAEDFQPHAIAFFEAVANKYGTTPNLIYEIYNEPLKATDWSTTVKPRNLSWAPKSCVIHWCD